MSKAIIVKAVIFDSKSLKITFGGMSMKAEVQATFNDGTTKKVLSFYDDELSFTAEEFIGLTEEETHNLFHKKDVAYLQS